jgi:opacity protein-like surface antigen
VMTGRRKISFLFLSTLFLSPLFLVGAGLPSSSIKLLVTAEQANIREKPDIASAILLQVPEGTALEADKKDGEWYAVKVEQEGGGFLIGYVHESLVKVVDAQEEKIEKKEVVEEKPPETKPQEPAPIPAPEPAAVSPQAPKPKAEPISVFLWGGGRYASVGDLNDGAKGLAQSYEYLLGVTGSGAVSPLHLGYLFGMEASFPLSSRVLFCFGAEYFSAENSSSISYEDGSFLARFTSKPRVRAIPVSLSLAYYLFPHAYVKAGLDYTFARLTYFYRFQEQDTWQEWEGHASSGEFGYQVVLGTDWKLFSNVCIVAEAAYRHSRISDLEGENSYRQSDGLSSREKGRLYYFEVAANGKDLVPLVFVRENDPAEAGVYNVRNAELGLSGVSLRAGIRIRF